MLGEGSPGHICPASPPPSTEGLSEANPPPPCQKDAEIHRPPADISTPSTIISLANSALRRPQGGQFQSPWQDPDGQQLSPWLPSLAESFEAILAAHLERRVGFPDPGAPSKRGSLSGAETWIFFLQILALEGRTRSWTRETSEMENRVG